MKPKQISQKLINAAFILVIIAQLVIGFLLAAYWN